MSADLRSQLHKHLAAIEASERENDDLRKRLRSAADTHHERAHQASERARAHLGWDDADSEEAMRYDEAVRGKHKATLVRGFLKEDE